MNRTSAIVTGITCALTSACAPRPSTCLRACDAPFTCASNECVPPSSIPAIEARDRLGDPQVRRLVFAPTDVARLAPGDLRAEVPRTAVLARDRDARAILLLRFALDLPPGITIVEAHLVLDRAPAVDADPAPVMLHAVRVVEPWDGQSLAWGRAPRMDDPHLPSTAVDDARREVRLDVRALVRRWKVHAPDDQGIAIVADRTSPTGTAFALADGDGASEHASRPLPVHAPGPPTVFTGGDGLEGAIERVSTQGPRLELYVKP